MKRRAVPVSGVLALAGLIAAAVAGLATPVAGAIQHRYRIDPGQSMGLVDLGMTRKRVESLLPGKPVRTPGHLYSLSYHYPDKDSGKLIITFNGSGKHAKAFYAITFEPNLATDENVGVGDRWNRMIGHYPSAHCYHSNPDGSREENYEDTDNFECELHSNGGFTYFGYDSFDADPQQHIGAIAVSLVKIP